MASTHFYDPSTQPHGLPHDPVKSCVAPRPIGWISSLSADGGVNLAPYSFFNLIADSPHMCMFGSSGEKDTLRNVEATGEFVFNIATEGLLHAMNRTATTLAADVDEFEAAGLTKLASTNVAPPRVAESPIHLECKVDQLIELPNNGRQRNAMVTALIVGVHIADHAMTGGLVDLSKVQPVSRLGYMQYATIGDELFSLRRPQNLDDHPEVG